ncbi:MAG: sigma-70 family RNA polymerase sigma factor [Bacteroidales bacterium]|nr:sigma-70 family RNA polymerase sigma factor [Bacteroidales bacterium]
MNYKNLSDQALLELYIKGSVAAFEELVFRHQTKLYNYILMMVRQPALAEDIFQETFVKVIKSIKEGKYYDDGKFLSWVTRIAHNLIIDHFRREKKMKLVSTDNEEFPVISHNLITLSSEEGIVKKQLTKEVRMLIEHLPVEQREVVIMRVYLDMSFKEIAEQTGVSLNTALGRMRYALINLRKLLAQKVNSA